MAGKNIVFADVAGLVDTGGPFMDLVNVFVMRKILKKIAKIKFLFVMTMVQIEECRGN